MIHMVVRLENLALITGVCLLIVFTASISGCTGSNSGTTNPVTNQPQFVQTSSVPASAGAEQTLTQIKGNTLAKTETQTTVQTSQAPETVSLTINSAKKMTKLFTFTPKSGNIFLVLDITVKNNGVPKGFDFTDTSITMPKLQGGAITSQVRGGLENPIITPTRIEQNDKRTGQIVFGVSVESNTYKLNLVDSKGEVLSSQTITVE